MGIGIAIGIGIKGSIGSGIMIMVLAELSTEAQVDLRDYFSIKDGCTNQHHGSRSSELHIVAGVLQQTLGRLQVISIRS